jgi:phosphopantetheine--protein transferase-like protein
MDSVDHIKPVVRIGTDILNIHKFNLSINDGGESLLKRLFHPSEFSEASYVRLASIYCAKEATFKALNANKGEWHAIEIIFDAINQPLIRLSPEFNTNGLVTLDLSIGMTHENVLATVVALYSR